MDTAKMNFAGRVALVTGAGNGLGRIYALQFASRGAAVVVNDLGGDARGGGASSRAADIVVNEIISKGGKAVANYDSVEFGDKLVETAIKTYGRIDIVVNNAGILRDKSFMRMSDEDWDLIHKVHMKGAFKVTRAAWPYMREQKFGRIIMVSSPAGIYGNFGQANYAAAKLGLVGFSNTLAREGAKYSINCNAIAPTAGSRLLQTVMPQDLVDALKPEYISPLVLYLCHESTEESGSLFELAAGWISRTRWQNSEGALVARRDKATGEVVMTPEDVRDNWAKINDFSNPEYRTKTADSNEKMMACLAELRGDDDTGDSKSNKTASKSGTWSYTDRDVILYALGIGCSTSQKDHLKFLFELSEDFSVLPTFPVLVSFNSDSVELNKETTGIDVDPTKILHGEQYIELYKPLPTAGTLKTVSEVADVMDKGSGANIILNFTSYDENGEKVCFNQNSIFVVGAGNFGGKRSSDKVIPVAKAPERSPDATVQEQTSIDQAAIYRLSGDRNPLHIDPAFAAMGGQPKPILHGLCSMGFAARHVLQQYADNDVALFKSMKVRFTKPVLPGHTIKTNMWREGNRIHFESMVSETGNKVITGGYVDLHSVAQTVPKADSNTLKSSAVFEEMKKRITPELVKKVNAAFQFNVTKSGKVAQSWTVDLKNQPGGITLGTSSEVKPGVTLTLADENLIDLVNGKLDAQKAFLSGKLKLKGNLMLAQKLQVLFKSNANL